MKKKLLYGMIAMLAGAALHGQSNSSNDAEIQKEIAKAREVIAGFVNTRQQIARLSNEWEAYQEMTKRRIDLYEAEIKRLNEQIQENRDDTTQAERVIDGIRAEISELRAANDIVKNALPGIEARLIEIAAYFPPPLRSKTQQFTQRLTKSRSASDGMAVVLAILNEVDKFNAEFTADTMQKQTAGGETKLVDVLYMGLSIAYYADSEGTVGGIGHPAADEWQWTDVDAATAARIHESITYFNNEIKPAMLVDLPVEVRQVTFGN